MNCLLRVLSVVHMTPVHVPSHGSLEIHVLMAAPTRLALNRFAQPTAGRTQRAQQRAGLQHKAFKAACVLSDPFVCAVAVADGLNNNSIAETREPCGRRLGIHCLPNTPTRPESSTVLWVAIELLVLQSGTDQ